MDRLHCFSFFFFSFAYFPLILKIIIFIHLFLSIFIYSDHAEANFYSPQGCKISKKSGLGFGSIMLIILAACVVLFFAIGIPIQYFVRHKKGLEIIPFFAFFVSIPGLVLDGVKFIFSPCCKRNDYAPIENNEY